MQKCWSLSYILDIIKRVRPNGRSASVHLRRMTMSSYSVRKPITVLMGILIIMVLGIFSVTRLPLTLFPEIELPFIVTSQTMQELHHKMSKKTLQTPLKLQCRPLVISKKYHRSPMKTLVYRSSHLLNLPTWTPWSLN